MPMISREPKLYGVSLLVPFFQWIPRNGVDEDAKFGDAFWRVGEYIVVAGKPPHIEMLSTLADRIKIGAGIVSVPRFNNGFWSNQSWGWDVLQPGFETLGWAYSGGQL
jgi:hypothetical protein